jgi:hypothetical protein
MYPCAQLLCANKIIKTDDLVSDVCQIISQSPLSLPSIPIKLAMAAGIEVIQLHGLFLTKAVLAYLHG